MLPNGLLLFESSVLNFLDQYRQRTFNCLEAGGILIGYRRGSHFHVVEATAPGQLDIRDRCSFERTDPSHQRIAHQRWLESNHRLDYIGEWHTHPQHHAVPSSIDSQEWGKLLNDTARPMLFVILGVEDHYWIGVGHRNRIERAYSFR